MISHDDLSVSNLMAMGMVDLGPLFSNQVTRKRLEKELPSLYELKLPGISISRPKLTQISLDIELSVWGQSRMTKFLIRLTRDYPFTMPRLMCLEARHILSEGRNLLHLILGNEPWGPSILLETIIEALPKLLTSATSPLRWHSRYFKTGQSFLTSELKNLGMVAFQVQKKEWRLLVRSSKPMIMVLTSSIILFLCYPNQQVVTLEKFLPLQWIVSAKGKVNEGIYSLEMREVNPQGQSNVLSIKGPANNLSAILLMLNPVQEIERRLNNSDGNQTVDSSCHIDWLMQLIEFYSNREPQKADKYMLDLKMVIQRKQQQQ